MRRPAWHDFMKNGYVLTNLRLLNLATRRINEGKQVDSMNPCLILINYPRAGILVGIAHLTRMTLRQDRGQVLSLASIRQRRSATVGNMATLVPACHKRSSLCLKITYPFLADEVQVVQFTGKEDISSNK